jgi:hypothetical protein
MVVNAIAGIDLDVSGQVAAAVRSDGVEDLTRAIRKSIAID